MVHVLVSVDVDTIEHVVIDTKTVDPIVDRGSLTPWRIRETIPFAHASRELANRISIRHPSRIRLQLAGPNGASMWIRRDGPEGSSSWLWRVGEQDRAAPDLATAIREVLITLVETSPGAGDGVPRR